jgi:ABC-2 type transport system permease protein
VSHLVTAARDLTMTGAAGVEAGFALLGSVAVVAVFAPLTVRAYMRRA